MGTPFTSRRPRSRERTLRRAQKPVTSKPSSSTFAIAPETSTPKSLFPWLSSVTPSRTELPLATACSTMLSGRCVNAKQGGGVDLGAERLDEPRPHLTPDVVVDVIEDRRRDGYDDGQLTGIEVLIAPVLLRGLL